MRWIAIVTDSSNEFHEFVKNLLGDEEYRKSVKSITQVCGPDLTKYIKVSNDISALGFEWDGYHLLSPYNIVESIQAKTRKQNAL